MLVKLENVSKKENSLFESQKITKKLEFIFKR